MTKKLLITFRPADYYFFGGEETFDVDTVPGVRNYLVRSNRIPQQTVIVGLLRHILLSNARNIGASSFQADWQADNPQEFGDLIRISPLFLQFDYGQARRFLLPAPKVFLADGTEISIEFQQSEGSGYTGDRFQEAPKLEFDGKNGKEVYTAKEQAGDFWIDLGSGEKIPALYERDENDKQKHNNGIFISSLHIGIDKMSRMKKRAPGQTGHPDEEGFYKQEFYRLAPGYRFAVVAEVAEAVPAEIFNTAMPFGGESRTFDIGVEDWTEDLHQLWQPSKACGSHVDRIVLCSDAFVSDTKALFALCRFAVAACRPFRNIQIDTSEYSPEAFANLHRKKRQELTYLIERGSVLFPRPGNDKDGKPFTQKIVEMLEAAHNFYNIGYNYFHPHKSSI